MSEVLTRRLSRRSVLRAGLLVGLTVPGTSLLAACGNSAQAPASGGAATTPAKPAEAVKPAAPAAAGAAGFAASAGLLSAGFAGVFAAPPLAGA